MTQRGHTSRALAVSRHAVVAEAFEIMADDLGPFIDERMAVYFADAPSWAEAAANRLGRPAEHGATDPLFQLLVLRRFWGPVFADFFGCDLRKLIGELIEVRNQWAHFRLPDEPESLERAVLAVERLLAPVTPEAAGRLRRLRSELIPGPVPVPASAPATGPPPLPGPGDPGAGDDPAVDVVMLESQLSETESVFRELQDRYDDLQDQLSTSRRIAAHKQLRLAALEQRLLEIEGQTEAAEEFLAEERYTRNRIEWLFVGLLATLLLFMVLAYT